MLAFSHSIDAGGATFVFKQTLQKPPGDSWLALVRKNASPEFGNAFTPDAVLEASALNGRLVRPAQIAAFFAASSGMYETISFTTEVDAGSSTYLEWTGRAFGLDLAGVTIISRDPAGLIERVTLHHRPYSVVLRVAAELAARLAGKADPGLLAGGLGEAPPTAAVGR